MDPRVIVRSAVSGVDAGGGLTNAGFDFSVETGGGSVASRAWYSGVGPNDWLVDCGVIDECERRLNPARVGEIVSSREDGGA